MLSAAAYPRPHAVDPSINQPARFVAGLLSGRTVRVELEEIQKADLGRKYARKDKRPLDPPPVVLCRFFDVLYTSGGKVIEKEIDPEQVSLGAICHVDLFPVPDVDAGLMVQPQPMFALPPLHLATQANVGPPAGGASALLPSGSQGFGAARTPYNLHPLDDANDPDIVAWMGKYAIRESSKCTPLLSGATFMQTAVVDHNGKKASVFVFSDLAVRMEGTFVLRYRCFNIYAQRAAFSPVSVLAECYGGPFKIHSTKEFPGLSASTSLTKHLALYGVRVNLRENERKRRKKSDMHSVSNDDAVLSAGEDDGEGPPPPPSGTERSASHSPAQTFHSPTTSIGSSFGAPEVSHSLPLRRSGSPGAGSFLSLSPSFLLRLCIDRHPSADCYVRTRPLYFQVQQCRWCGASKFRVGQPK
ncbi:velvet factor-domain-containing protein [Trametes maxima]|nr:velvet factor-domain-containing protein [Trametes maxima]